LFDRNSLARRRHDSGALFALDDNATLSELCESFSLRSRFQTRSQPVAG
jgi:hypothetical protein